MKFNDLAIKRSQFILTPVHSYALIQNTSIKELGAVCSQSASVVKVENISVKTL